jgi:hypothetical protein
MSGSLSWIAPLLQGGASLYGAYTANQAGRTQANAANQAAQTQANSTNAQLNLLAQMYNQSRDDMAPYRSAGQAGLGAYAANLAQPFQQTPGYQFLQNEAMRGVMANQSARGMVNSGATLRALQDRAAGIADQSYGQYMNRLAALSGIGQTAAGQGASAAQGYGGQAAGVMGQGAQAQNQFLTQGAGALASGQNQAANALMGGANNLLSYWSMGR